MASNSRGLRRSSIPVLAALFLVVSLTVFANATTPPVLRYVPSLTPTCSVSGSVATYEVTVQNSLNTTPGQTISSFTLDANDSSFRFSQISGPYVITAPAGKHWNDPIPDHDADGFKITAMSGTANRLLPGESLTVSFSIMAPTLTPGGPTSFKWSTKASGSAGGYSLDTDAAFPVSQIKTACVGAPASISFATAPSDTAAGTIMTPSVVVKVTDGLNGTGNPVPNDPVTLSSPGLVNAPVVNTDASGLATFDLAHSADLTVSNAAGSYTATAQDGVAPDATAPFKVTVPAAFAFVQQPSDHASTPTVEGQPDSQPVTVRFLDNIGQPVSGANVELQIDNNPPGDATLSYDIGGACAIAGCTTDASGIATFTGLTISKSSTGFTLKACTPDCTSPNHTASSDAFTISTVTTTDCPPSGCTGTVGDPNNVGPGDQAVTVVVPPGGDGGTLVVTVEGDPSAFPSCGAGFTAPVVTIVPPPGFTDSNPIEVTFFNYLPSVTVGLRPVCKIVDLVGGGTTTSILDSCSTTAVPCIVSESYDTITGVLASTIDLTSTDPHIRTTP